jgi:hypothetical protein
MEHQKKLVVAGDSGIQETMLPSTVEMVKGDVLEISGEVHHITDVSHELDGEMLLTTMTAHKA